MNYRIPSTRAALLAGFLTAALPARSAVVVQYSFEGNLNDTAAAGSVADNLTYNKGVAVSATPVEVIDWSSGARVAMRSRVRLASADRSTRG